MKKIKENILALIIMIAGLYFIGFILHILELIAMKISPAILIIAFCYFLYKVLIEEV